MSSKVVTRFPPSPTGYLHIGSARTALYNHLFAANRGGEMLMRFEDTDRERSKKEFEQDIIEGLEWLGIPFDKSSFIQQSERSALYHPYIQKLIEAGAAYEAEESKEDSSKKVVRFKNPNTSLTFEDLVRGPVTFDTTELKDFVIAKNKEEPLYHLAVVIDDFEMGVTHVIRGEDHISNTPRQILILEALGFPRAHYAHIPLILAPDRTKLSKRHGAVSVNEYRQQGFIPEALINYLALLGWNPGGEQEVFTLAQLEGQFSLERVHKGGAVFDIEKLKWFNHEHLRKLTDEEYAVRLQAFSGRPVDSKLIPLLKERVQTLRDAADALEGEFSFLQKVDYDSSLLLQHNKLDRGATKKHLEHLDKILENATPTQEAQDIKNLLMPYAEREGRGAVLWPLRVALSGQQKSPDPFIIIAIVGKNEARQRIAEALKKL